MSASSLEHELDLQMALGPALIATRITNHPDVGRTYARARSCLSDSRWGRDVHALRRGLQVYR